MGAFCSTLTSWAQFSPEEIEIIRDKWGVPHIYAPTDAQVAYGLAWAHSEDDFATIQGTILAAKQMLGRHLGKDGAPIDYVVGLLRCDDIVTDHWNEIDPQFLKLVEGYVAGFNAYAKHHPKEVLVNDAFPVTAKEVFKAYVLQLAVQDGADRIVKNLFDGKVDEFEFDPKGSNAFAISREKTTNDNVFLAVNSHQPFEGPAAWYEAHLVSDEGWNMLGGLFPGGPVVFHGTNENLGWAHTVNYFDKIDVFQLEMHPERDDTYKLDNEWKELEVREIRLKVKVLFGLNLTVKRKALYSKYGPVVKNDKGFFAFHMSVFDEIRAIEQWYKMNKAENLSAFKKALSMAAIPSFNIVYADHADNLYYIGNGNIPVRNPKYDWSTTLPGNTSETLPTNYHLFNELPQITNPPSGYVFNTNNGAFNATGQQDNLVHGHFDPTMGYRDYDNNRSLRFMELIQAHEKLSWEDFLTIKYDQTLPDTLVYRLNINPIFRLDPGKDPDAKEVIEIIQAWNKTADVESVGTAHLNLLYVRLSQTVKRSEWNKVPEIEFYNAAKYVKEYLLKHFGTLQVELGTYQRLVRGDRDYPVSGMTDVIAAMNPTNYENGKVKGQSGESYIMMVQYPKEGLPIIETINVFGASNKPESPHYVDQLPLFLNKERKKMTLDIEEVRKNAARIYSPGQ